MLRSSLTRVGSRAAARPSALLQVRGLAGPTKVQITELDDVMAPFEVERDEPLLEMGVLYPPGKGSPMESVLSEPPIVVDGVMVKTGGGPTGHPIEYIRLSAWCAVAPLLLPAAPAPSLSARCSEDVITPAAPPTPQGPDARRVQVLGDAVCQPGGSGLCGVGQATPGRGPGRGCVAAGRAQRAQGRLRGQKRHVRREGAGPQGLRWA